MNQIRFLAVTAVLSASLFISGCGWGQPKEEDNSLLISSTTQFSHYSQVMKAEFEKKRKNSAIIIQEGDTTPGILSLRNGAIDIAIASRDLNENEDDKTTQSHLITKDAIHIVVHPANPMEDLTAAQLKNIYSGKTDNWNPLGGGPSPIMMLSADPASDTYAGLIDLVMDGEGIAATAVFKSSGKDIIDAVAANKNAIGFVASRDLSQDVKALKINKVEATRSTIYSGSYPLTRAFYFVVKSEPSRLTRQFIDYYLSKEGQEIWLQEGALPLH